jgi:uncharacterized protein (DUF1501 family)
MWTRRAFLKAGGLAAFSVSVGGSPLFLARAARAAAPISPFGRRKTLVTIFQRGAMDGLMAVSPVGDSNLLKVRPRIGMSAAGSAGANSLIDLGTGYAIHPAFASFVPLFKEGRLAVVHGVGSPDTTRSHFDAQDYMETGTPGNKGTSSGWLNRACGLAGHDATPFRAVAMTPALPRSLYGDEEALAISDLNEFGLRLPNAEPIAKASGKGFEALYEQTTQDLLRGTGRESFEAIRMLSKTEVAGYQPSNGAAYPNSPLGKSLKQIAQLIKANVGLEVAFTETGGWDTHVQQGTINGTFAQRARDLSQSIVAFWTDLGSFRDDVALMTMTEFGRTVRENGSGGTDHGRASCMFVLGTNVDGGKVHGKIVSLDADALEEKRDLPVTTDFRALFSDVAGTHLGITKDELLFPGWNGGRIQVMKA